jgi:hypothetical protein
VASCSILAQAPVVPPAAIEQLQNAIGDRVELGTILGGDYAAAGGIYSIRGGQVADLNLTKIGGGGVVAARKPLGIGELQWAPVLEGNLGRLQAENRFESGYLKGNRSTYNTGAIQGGGGARFYLTDRLSTSPTISGLYGHTENEFTAGNAVGDLIKQVGSGSYVDWQVDTWTVAPGLDLRYDWVWGRTVFQFRSSYEFFHTESFKSSSPTVGVNGDSQTWENKVDVDVPLGWTALGGEFHTGGFFSRTQLYGGAARGLGTSGFFTTNGRFVWDPKGKLWKLHWVGLGGSYFWDESFQGWSAGLDLAFSF